MKGKLFKITDPHLKRCFRSHIFYCIDKSKYVGNIFINIKSGTIVETAIWNKYDIIEIPITDKYQTMIDKQLIKPKTKKIISMYGQSNNNS